MKYIFLLFFFSLFINVLVASDTKHKPISKVWIFCGSTGDQTDNLKFKGRINAVKTALISNFQFQENEIHIYFNNGDGKFNSCIKDNIVDALSNINENLKENSCLLLFLGHANSTIKGINYNLPGQDISVKEIADKLDRKNCTGNLGIIWALESGKRAVKLLGAANTIIMASSETEDLDNEPVLNELIEKMFDSKLADMDMNQDISFAEMHELAKQEIKVWYQNRGLIQLETVILDGDSDGIGTSAPSLSDKKGALNMKLIIKQN